MVFAISDIPKSMRFTITRLLLAAVLIVILVAGVVADENAFLIPKDQLVYIDGPNATLSFEVIYNGSSGNGTVRVIKPGYVNMSNFRVNQSGMLIFPDQSGKELSWAADFSKKAYLLFDVPPPRKQGQYAFSNSTTYIKSFYVSAENNLSVSNISVTVNSQMRQWRLFERAGSWTDVSERYNFSMKNRVATFSGFNTNSMFLIMGTTYFIKDNRQGFTFPEGDVDGWSGSGSGGTGGGKGGGRSVVIEMIEAGYAGGNLSRSVYGNEDETIGITRLDSHKNPFLLNANLIKSLSGQLISISLIVFEPNLTTTLSIFRNNKSIFSSAVEEKVSQFELKITKPGYYRVSANAKDENGITIGSDSKELSVPERKRDIFGTGIVILASSFMILGILYAARRINK
ncbi:hypothetical protein HYU11_03385 [Candidatus Woesearchaeota archaeon]|nr:hypothetical protein [Candidatus Woesearchaeota archaeon]